MKAAELRRRDPEEYVRRSTATMVVHVNAMLALKRAGAVAFDYGNNIRRFAFDAGCADAFLIPGFVPEYIRPLFCTGQGPFRWVALSGDPKDIDRTDELALELFPDNEILTRWLRLARGRFAFQGLPARICWLGYGERARMGEAINELVRKGEISAPDRHRPRPSRHRLGGQSLSRDGEDARRLGRRGRLAHSQRAAQHRIRAQPGSASTTAAAWAWATRCTPDKSPSPTARTMAARKHCARAQQRSWPRCGPPRRRGLRTGAHRPRANAASTFPWRRSERDRSTRGRQYRPARDARRSAASARRQGTARTGPRLKMPLCSLKMAASLRPALIRRTSFAHSCKSHGDRCGRVAA